MVSPSRNDLSFLADYSCFSVMQERPCEQPVGEVSGGRNWTTLVRAFVCRGTKSSRATATTIEIVKGKTGEVGSRGSFCLDRPAPLRLGVKPRVGLKDGGGEERGPLR